MHSTGSLDWMLERLKGTPEIADVFVPRRVCIRRRGAKVKRELEAVLPGYLFVRASHANLIKLKKTVNALKFSVWPNDDEGTRYIWVADGEMENFRKVCIAFEEKVEYFKPDEITLIPGQKIEVIGGELNGVKGWFQRVKGHRSRRLVVKLDNILSATVELLPDLVRPLP